MRTPHAALTLIITLLSAALACGPLNAMTAPANLCESFDLDVLEETLVVEEWGVYDMDSSQTCLLVKQDETEHVVIRREPYDTTAAAELAVVPFIQEGATIAVPDLGDEAFWALETAVLLVREGDEVYTVVHTIGEDGLPPDNAMAVGVMRALIGQ